MKKLLKAPEVVRMSICPIDWGGNAMAGAAVWSSAAKRVVTALAASPATTPGLGRKRWLPMPESNQPGP
jgi:hypothetical protein